MYCGAYTPHEALIDDQIVKLSGGAYELPSDGLKASEHDIKAS
jgi:hypothetical protein